MTTHHDDESTQLNSKDVIINGRTALYAFYLAPGGPLDTAAGNRTASVFELPADEHTDRNIDAMTECLPSDSWMLVEFGRRLPPRMCPLVAGRIYEALLTLDAPAAEWTAEHDEICELSGLRGYPLQDMAIACVMHERDARLAY